jgi:hypothetical protein
MLDVKPNAAHLELARLERIGKLKAVVTQNIDGLHYAAGSKNVLEIHGSVHRNYCFRCHKCYSAEFVRDFDGTPQCPECGGLIKPDVVLYGENLKPEVTNAAIDVIEKADMLIVGGTSLTVYPAASFIEYYRGNKLVLINKTETDFDDRVDLLIHGSIGEALTFHITEVPEPPAEVPAEPAQSAQPEQAPERHMEVMSERTVQMPSEAIAEIPPEATAEPPVEVPTETPEPPAKPPRKRTRKKAADKSENAENNTEEIPQKKPRKRKKKADDDVTA